MNTQPRIVAAALGFAQREFADVLRAFKAALPWQLQRHGALPELKNPLSEARIAEITGMTARNVQRWWRSDLDSSFTDAPRSGRKHILSAADLAVVVAETGKRHRGTRTIKKILATTGTNVDHVTIWRQLHADGLKPWHRRREPFSSVAIETVRVQFVDYNWSWVMRNWRLVAPSDEFYIHVISRLNSKTDIVWARDRADIEDLLRAPEVKFSSCIGFYLCFTQKRMVWSVKRSGESWTGDYFRNTVIKKTLVPFLRDPANCAGHVTATCVLHDNAPGWKAYATQALLDEEKIDHFPSRGDGRYAPYSPFFNPCEMLGSYIQTETEKLLVAGPASDRFKVAALEVALMTVLRANEYNQSLFTRLLTTLPRTMRMVRMSEGKPVHYHG